MALESQISDFISVSNELESIEEDILSTGDSLELDESDGKNARILISLRAQKCQIQKIQSEVLEQIDVVEKAQNNVSVPVNFEFLETVPQVTNDISLSDNDGLISVVELECFGNICKIVAGFNESSVFVWVTNENGKDIIKYFDCSDCMLNFKASFETKHYLRDIAICPDDPQSLYLLLRNTESKFDTIEVWDILKSIKTRDVNTEEIDKMADKSCIVSHINQLLVAVPLNDVLNRYKFYFYVNEKFDYEFSVPICSRDSVELLGAFSYDRTKLFVPSYTGEIFILPQHQQTEDNSAQTLRANPAIVFLSLLRDDKERIQLFCGTNPFEGTFFYAFDSMKYFGISNEELRPISHIPHLFFTCFVSSNYLVAVKGVHENYKQLCLLRTPKELQQIVSLSKVLDKFQI